MRNIGCHAEQPACFAANTKFVQLYNTTLVDQRAPPPPPLPVAQTQTIPLQISNPFEASAKNAADGRFTVRLKQVMFSEHPAVATLAPTGGGGGGRRGSLAAAAARRRALSVLLSSAPSKTAASSTSVAGAGEKKSREGGAAKKGRDGGNAGAGGSDDVSTSVVRHVICLPSMLDCVRDGLDSLDRREQN